MASKNHKNPGSRTAERRALEAKYPMLAVERRFRGWMEARGRLASREITTRRNAKWRAACWLAELQQDRDALIETGEAA